MKKGQVTVFVIIGIVIVIIGVLIYLFYPKIEAWFIGPEINPNGFMQNCIGEEIKNNLELVSSQGGSINPGHYILYKDQKIEYLCYTEEYYLTCVMQQPMLKRHIETEIENQIKNKAKECFNSMREEYNRYNPELIEGEINVELLPNKIVTTFNSTLTITDDTTQRYEKFIVSIDNNLYELVNIANSILNWEAAYGDAETTTYMNYYPNIKVEKDKQLDGSTVYIITDRDTKDKLQFASRSVAWPPGYGSNPI